jgi:fumarylacetoacetase
MKKISTRCLKILKSGYLYNSIFKLIAKYYILKYILLNLMIVLFIILHNLYYMEANKLESWVVYSPDTQFPIQNFPFGVCFLKKLDTYRCCSRIGDYVIDLYALESQGLFNSEEYTHNTHSPIFNHSTLNTFISHGRTFWKAIREILIKIFKKDSINQTIGELSLHHISTVEMRMPVHVGDYTDFYSSKNHAFNMGAIIRGPENALQPNWVHLPVAYHGRSSTIVIDRTGVKRPRGQVKPLDKDSPIFSECKRLDFEVEVGVIIGKSNKMGESVKTKDAEDYVFGLVLLNDWSARDLQTWEYVPLGPFTAKNFATTISPWIVTLEALNGFEVQLPKQDPTPLKYLQEENLKSWDIPINVYLTPSRERQDNKESLIATTNYKYMYWTINQQIAHHTVSGCKLNVGDILGSGTISGTDPGTYGSLFELNNGGKKKIQVGDNERVWIEDYDYVRFEAVLKGDGFNIGFGDCGGEIIPANPEEEYY